MTERRRLADRRAGQLELFCQPATPLPPRDRTHGLLVQLPTACRCDCEFAVVGEGKAMHAASLCCVECGVHRGWLSHATYKFITEIITQFGRPTEPIVIRGDGAGAD